jgi:hypothetical protein
MEVCDRSDDAGDSRRRDSVGFSATSGLRRARVTRVTADEFASADILP